MHVGKQGHSIVVGEPVGEERRPPKGVKREVERGRDIERGREGVHSS